VADPLDRLRLPIEPADPPAAFVTALEARMRNALDDLVRTRSADAPGRFHADITPGLAYADAPAAITWLEDVLGFRTVALYVGDDGAVRFSQLVYRRGAVTLHTENDAGRLDQRGRSSIGVLVDTPGDVDRAYERAVAAGAKVAAPLEDAFYGGRGFSLEDPEGNLWHVGSPWLDSDAALHLPERRL
jgi:uncharacterized glyoxalase superfamily protein PhnB